MRNRGCSDLSHGSEKEKRDLRNWGRVFEKTRRTQSHHRTGIREKRRYVQRYLIVEGGDDSISPGRTYFPPFQKPMLLFWDWTAARPYLPIPGYFGSSRGAAIREDGDARPDRRREDAGHSHSRLRRRRRAQRPGPSPASGRRFASVPIPPISAPRPTRPVPGAAHRGRDAVESGAGWSASRPHGARGRHILLGDR